MGENKIFIYNPQSIKKTDYVKGKLKVLNKLNKDNIDDLFDQKAVFDYFYKKLWDLRLELGREIRDKNGLSDNISLMEAQHIIDRIIFTYFVCEKDLVSVKGHGPITGKQLFSDIIVKMDDPWKYLKMLFFDQFAKENSEGIYCGKNVLLKAKYLNGGLFREKELTDKKIKETTLNIEYEWQNIFDILNRYTWIIEDEIPDFEGEYEGNLTPEIIGHIYEKFVISLEELSDIEIDKLNTTKSGDLKKGNKKIGAYYTPEYITDYISRKNITPYLFDNLKISDEITFEQFLDNSNEEILHKALDILNDVKICDPAAGSGAFLIKAGEILLEYKLKIIKQLKDSSMDKYALKKDIIIKNLYGVDIQEGAIEICKLRLWLWLISSAKSGEMEPLPNIEYNFVVGNSLVGWVNEKLNQSVLIRINETHIKPLITLKIGYKAEQRKTIDLVIQLLRKTDVQSYAKALVYLKGLYSYSAGDDAEILKEVIEWTRSAIYEKIDGIFYDYIQSHGCNISFEDYDKLCPFHWKVDFNDIFENGGFNIIIGNPPYMSGTGKGKVKMSTESIKFYKSIYKKILPSHMNLFAIFIYKSFNILKSNEYLGFIVPNFFLTKSGSIKLREFILENSQINEIIDLGTTVFSNSQVPVVIFNIKLVNGFKKLNEISYVQVNSKDFIQMNYEECLIPQTQFEEDDNKAFICIDKRTFNLLKKISNFTPLSKIAEINYGIVTGNNDVYITDEPNERNKKLVAGKDIHRYYLSFNNNYVYYEDLVKNRKEEKYIRIGDKNIYEAKEKGLIKHIGYDLTVAYDNEQFYPERTACPFIVTDLNYELKYVISLLNSKLINFYYKNKFIDVRIQKISLNQIPVFPADKSQQKLLIKNVDKLLLLNKELNEEINSFINWLLNEFKITKLSTKLYNYYNLPFNLFLDELKKKKVNNNLDLLKERFYQSLAVITPLIKQINETECEIDEMVYDLYGLTREEREIIEESLNQ